jgi:hypothetical protein
LRPRILNLNWQGRILTDAFPGKLRFEYDAFSGLFPALVKNEIPQAVDNYAVVVFFYRLKHMGVMPQNQIRTGVD